MAPPGIAAFIDWPAMATHVVQDLLAHCHMAIPTMAELPVSEQGNHGTLGLPTTLANVDANRQLTAMAVAVLGAVPASIVDHWLLLPVAFFDDLAFGKDKPDLLEAGPDYRSC